MDGIGARWWVVDDVPSRRFPIYTRGNTGEVYPNVITPLCGSVVKDHIAAGQARVFLEMGAVVPADMTETGCAVLTGCFAGYLYANLSVGRLLGARTPGMKPDDADEQMFGTVGAPPYRRQPGDRNLWATARLGRFMGRVFLRGVDFGWLAHERTDVAAWVAAQPEPADATTEQLLATVDAGAAWLEPLMRSLILAGAYGGIAASVIDRIAGRADPSVRARLAVGVGNVESAEPAAELWRLARRAAASPAVSAALDGGAGMGARLAGLGPEGDEFRAAFDRFLERFGSRGPDEWELASHTWGTDPDIALAAVERLRHADIPDPDTVRERLAGERADAVETVGRALARPVRPMFRRAAALVAKGAAGRELSKGTIVLALYPVRRALFELVRRAQDAGGPAERLDCWLVTRAEMPAFLERPGDFADVIAERRERRDLLQSRIPPFVFEGEIPDPHTWAVRAGARSVPASPAGSRLSGMGVSPGVARGRTRVIRDPADPAGLAPGEILVAPITDPAWTPLFLVAAGVVCEVGANMSHAAIVARELGIPAVVGVEGATDRIPDGCDVEIDGTAGTVSVL